MAHENRTLIVMVAPSVWDNVYQDEFVDIINFQLEFAKTLHEHENVVLIADKHTMPYLDGRVPNMKNRLPYDALIEANLYDINVHDYAPLGVKNLVKFIYRNKNMADISDKQVDDGFNRFLIENRIRIDKRETELALSGRDVVDNGVNKAVVSQVAQRLNENRLPEWGIMIKLFNAFRKVVMVEKPEDYDTQRLDDIFLFIDDDILAIPPLKEPERTALETEINRKFRNEIMLIDLPISGLTPIGNCGFYTAALTTDKYVYVPVYGNDPSNWNHGFSTMDDKMALNMIGANTRKKVVPISVPMSFCKRNLSLRSITWTVHGQTADQLISIPRRKFTL
ncbi:unnamed protein product [Bursaphelenchus okinawaensis]|uniref:Uncharacterized protein n=1 Tax=Bursaphelenchus okinawaensis TaxID=465554 RepID=A0A811K8M6_9BILA|nr:unnamed protein product [Bursaphelenchus okinawaensis]CAG9095834.1 unnamed protein product [Bursaphelenchus okinawaensis]